MENDFLKKLSEPLNVSDIDFRVQSINKGGFATILAYKNARVDMNRLDNVCGALWQDTYQLIDGQLFCKVGIKIGDEWIWREDVGVESYAEKTKGRASDAFKRACFRWGIGRELYDYPLIQVKLNSNELIEKNGKLTASWGLKLKEWTWDAEFKENKIINLVAKDQNGIVRYLSDKKIKVETPPSTPPAQGSNINTTQPKANTKELSWLNIYDANKQFTPQWKNLTEAINNKKISSVEEVRKHYKVSKKVEEKIVELLNY